MRIEKRKMGTRVRVILNRIEAREAGLRVLETAGKCVRGILARSSHIFIGSTGETHITGNGMYVDSHEFEKACRLIVAKKLELPVDTNFRIGLDNNGGVMGATFQFYTGIETEING